MLSLVFDICYYLNFILIPIIIFVYFSRDDNFHSKGGLQYFLKFFFARRAIKKRQEKFRNCAKSQLPNSIEDAKSFQNETQSDTLSFFAVDQNQNQLRLKLTLRANNIAEVMLCLRINKKIYILPSVNNTTDCYPIWTESIRKYEWKCKGLNIEILEPFKRCRVSFNGFLTCVTTKNENTTEHIKFNLIWNCCSKPNISWLDDDLNLLTRCLAKTKWNNAQWIDLLGDEKGFLQFGGLRGEISGDKFKTTELNMACAKRRFWGSLESESISRCLTIFAATENGYLIHFGVKSLLNGCQEMKFGHVHYYTGHVVPIESTDLEVKKINQSVSDKFTIHVRTGEKTLKLVLSIDKNSAVNFLNNNFNGYQCRNIFGECDINSNRGMAILDHWCSHIGSGVRKPAPILKELNVEYVPKIFVTPIGSEDSKILELVGGKACSLALMKSIATEEFTVPEGFVVTTWAFVQQIKNNLELMNSLLVLEDIALGKKEGNLVNICKETVKLFEKQPIMQSISQSVIDQLMKFRKNHDDDTLPFLKWAVRSSAIGEDSEKFSSAGQNATFLHSQNHPEILHNIAKCWASLYSYQSVIYRRQHGLPIINSMAVVVQKIIPATSAGVLFTCHPSTSNPSKIVITSNFGLGETVVSGESEPDTIILSKDFKGNVTFESSTIGSKSHSILISKHGLHTNSNREKSRDLSLTTEQAVALGKIGVILEKSYGGHRDIEWAIFNDQIYILQSRPVTTINQWTDFELLHELDSPHVANDIFYTKANIGEVSPFALTSLTQTAIMEKIEKSCQLRMFGSYDPYVAKSIVVSHHHGMIELLAGLYGRPKKKFEKSAQLVDLAVFGRVVLTEEINSKAYARYGETSNLKNILDLKDLWTSGRVLNKLISDSERVNIDLRPEDTLDDMYKKIDKFLMHFMEISYKHVLVSSVSVIYQVFSMMFLLNGAEDISIQHYNDLALILACCEDVVSAEVPRRLEKIAEALKSSSLAQKFASLPTEEGIEWLAKNCQEAHKLFKEFLRLHGHRLLGEMELSLNSWEMEPEIVIKMIQAICKVENSREKKETQIDVNQLSSLNNFFTRSIMRFLINKQRKAVGNREKAKSAFVKTADKIRKAYKILAAQMTIQGLLPSPNLIYHLTQYEIWQVIHRKNPNLISKALRRQKLYPTWNQYKFPEISFGLPVPEVQAEQNRATDSTVICHGTPVYVGDVTARACVITSLDQIHLLKEGDVLITKSTDIGWSPYFPILSGIVTELGGLVSHGAVVAREYGLPCIVGAKNATNLFKTGDLVYLSGKNGVLQLCKNK